MPIIAEHRFTADDPEFLDLLDDGFITVDGHRLDIDDADGYALVYKLHKDGDGPIQAVPYLEVPLRA